MESYIERDQGLRAGRGKKARTSVIQPKMLAWKQMWFSEMYNLP
jgi:hypothetical protein